MFGWHQDLNSEHCACQASTVWAPANGVSAHHMGTEGKMIRPAKGPRITCSGGLKHRADEGSADGVGILGTEGGQSGPEEAGS